MSTKLRESINELKNMQMSSDAVLEVVLTNVETLISELNRKINEVDQRIDSHSKNLDAHKE